MVRKLVWDQGKCLFCGGCVAVCPVGSVLILYDDDLKLQHDKCSSCGICVKACPMGVLSLGDA